MTLKIITPRRGKTHVLAHQHQTPADLAMWSHARETLCGRRVDGQGGRLVHGGYGLSPDCRQCALVAERRGWI
jgi:hypothetical protein